MKILKHQEHENLKHIYNDCVQTISRLILAKHQNQEHGGRKYKFRDCEYSENCKYLGSWAKKIESKDTLLSQKLRVEKRLSLFFFI